MNAPIDIVIDIIKSHLNSVKDEKDLINVGKAEAYQELIDLFEGCKKIFN